MYKNVPLYNTCDCAYMCVAPPEYLCILYMYMYVCVCMYVLLLHILSMCLFLCLVLFVHTLCTYIFVTMHPQR